MSGRGLASQKQGHVFTASSYSSGAVINECWDNHLITSGRKKSCLQYMVKLGEIVSSSALVKPSKVGDGPKLQNYFGQTHNSAVHFLFLLLFPSFTSSHHFHLVWARQVGLGSKLVDACLTICRPMTPSWRGESPSN